MSLFKEMKSRQIQKKANNFIESLKNKSDKQIELAYLNNKELENNEIVLSYLFFNHTSLIRILPLKFQISRINSNLNMFKYGSIEAKKKLVSLWIKNNKFFMNALVVGFDEEEYMSYLKTYFKQPDDIVLLYMDDLSKVVETLSKCDLKQTEELIEKEKDKFTDRQWEYIIEVNPIFIKYASQEIQKKYSEDEKYVTYLSGEARKEYTLKQVDKIREDISLLDTVSVDIQREYIKEYPYMINYLKDETLIEILKYDIELIKYVNLSTFKNRDDKTQEVVCALLDNIETKSNKDLVNILVNKCLLNAKGKLYRYDPNSNDISYQYTKRVIKLLQNLTMEQITALIMVDVNYILPYIVPVYNSDTPREEKEKVVIDCNSRCLNIFKLYFGDEIYDKYYKVINKIYNEYIANIDKYDYEKDYRCIFELFKVLFNKNIITKNNTEKVTLFIGTSILYKDDLREESKKVTIKLLNDLLSVAYDRQINNNREIYNINSLELFDGKLSFIDRDLLIDYSKYNFVNVSNLLLLIKSSKVYELFKTYYEIIKTIYGENKESLYKSIENFIYFKDILEDIKDVELNDDELENLTMLLSTFTNPYNIKNKSELDNYDLELYRNLVSDLAAVKDEKVYKNLLCNYLYNKGYDEKGNQGWLEVDTIKNICDIYGIDALDELEVEDKKVFDSYEVNLFRMTKLLFSINDFDLLLSFIENVITKKVKRNILSISELFNKIKKYRIELINKQIVNLDDIENLYIARPDMVMKNIKDDVAVYTVVGQDFKVLCSINDDGIHYNCVNVTELDKNSYGYNKLVNDNSIRFTTEDDKTIIKVNKDSYEKSSMKASFIIVVGNLSDELMEIAKKNNLSIIEIQNW